MSILVVEDSPTQAMDLRTLLEREGFRVVPAPDGETAIDLFRRQHFELVASDVLMPKMTGYDLCRAIKKESPDVPVMLLTALSDPMELVHALECGADSFVRKPYDPKQLVGRINALRESRALRAAQEENGSSRILFMGKAFDIRADREQVLDLLLATFEDMLASNGALEHQKAELERVQRQKDELSGFVVHDLKSPLNGIFLLLRVLLRSKSIGADDRENLELIRSSCEQMLRMVMNLLDISKGEVGALVPQKRTFMLGELLDEVTNEMSYRAKLRQQTVAMEGTLASPVNADRELIRRVVENLIDNALKYSPAGAAIRVELAPGEKGVAVVRVRDSGSGVPEAQRQRIFEKYTRVSESGDTARTSRGMGLAFCKLAVEAHGGQIWVEPNTPVGSCFCFALPWREE